MPRSAVWGLPDWDAKPQRDPATGRFVATDRDHALASRLGSSTELAALLNSQPDGAETSLDALRFGLSRIYGDNAQQVVTWATELSGPVQVKCARVLLENHNIRSGRELAKRVRQVLTLDEAAEIERWLAKE